MPMQYLVTLISTLFIFITSPPVNSGVNQRKMAQNIKQAFESVILDSRFKESLLLISQSNPKVMATDEFRWYSKMNIAIENKEQLSDEEMVHFLAMHKTFLQIL